MKTTMTGLLAGLSVIALSPAMAQVSQGDTRASNAAVPEPGSGEIVVTAQKRAQNIQDVGIAITALNNNALNLVQKSDITQLATAVPSLQVQQYSPTLTVFNIRGVSQNDFGDFQEAPIAFYSDEVYIASLGAIAGQAFDLERVEVLRGPQGTLFGRNATGGLVQQVTAKPTKTLQGFATLTFGSYGEIASEAAISGPLTDHIRARVAFTSDKYNGYVQNLYPGGRDGDNKEFYAARGQIEADVGDRGLFRLKVEYLHDAPERATAYRNIPAGDNADCLGVVSSGDGVGAQNCPSYASYIPFLANYGYVPSSNPFKQSWNTDSLFKRTYWNVAGRYEHDLGFATLTSITNYQHLNKTYSEDSDASPFDVLGVGTSQRFYQLSEELRLAGKTDRLTWTTGVFGLKLHSVDPEFVSIPDPAVDYNADINARVNTKSVAVFGQAEYKLTDIFTAIVGGRYSWDWKHINLDVNTTQQDVFSTTFPFPTIPFSYQLNHDLYPDLAHQTFKNYSGKVELDAKLNRDTLLYASINRGTKSGGFNVPYVIFFFNPPNPSSLVYNQEVLTNFEGGFKLNLFDRKVTFNGTAFHYRYHNYQAFSFFNGNSAITNQPARVTGTEVELNVRPTRAVNLGAYVTYLPQAEVKDVVLPLGRITNTRMPQAPKWSVGWSGDVTAPLGETAKLKLATNWKYDTEQYFTTLNAPIERQPPKIVGNVRASVLFHHDRLEAALNVNNVTNKYYRVFVADDSFVGVGQGTYARPRWFSGSLTYRFGE